MLSPMKNQRVVGDAGAGGRDVVHVDLADLHAVAALVGGRAVITILTQDMPVKSNDVRARADLVAGDGRAGGVQVPSLPLVEASDDTSKW